MAKESGKSWKNYVGGEWTAARSGAELPVIDPATAEVFAYAPKSSAADVDEAVAAARAAFRTRALYDMKPAARAKLLYDVAAELRKLGREIVPLMTEENGKSLAFSEDELECAARYFEYYAGLADKVHGRSIPLGAGYVDYTQLVPLGVSGQIVPWNFPLEIAARSLAPALAGANAVVIKTPELSPLAISHLATACVRAGVPAGYVNIVSGLGDEAGEALAAHAGIDQVVFTGSVATGRRILRHAAEHVRPAVMELGGKSAAIVYADADLKTAARSIAIGAFAHAGQVCSAGSRIVVQRAVHDALIDEIGKVIAGFTMGPGKENHFLTPLISEGQMTRVLGYCKAGAGEGAEAVYGSAREQRTGYYVQPTVFVGVKPEMKINREEIFGPVLSALTFDSPEEALALANGTEYGLAAGVYTRDLRNAHWTADRLEAGTVFINEWFAGGNETPFGGMKKSGFGREKSVDAFANYVQTRNIAVKYA
jgi:aldehyde dehydrogenase (NAD+)/betaine-aldehyde dehydrogenase